jgi:hypothetical protein
MAAGVPMILLSLWQQVFRSSFSLYGSRCSDDPSLFMAAGVPIILLSLWQQVFR